MPVLCVTADFVSLALVDFKVVAVTAPATEPPIVVPSTVPPFISAVVTVPKSETVAPLKVIVPVPVKFVAVIAPAVVPPIVTPSIVPPFKSTVVTVPKSEIVALAADMAAESSVTVPLPISVQPTLKVFPEPTCSPTEVPEPAAAKRASRESKSVLILVPQVSVEAPTSGLVKLRFVVVVSAICIYSL